MQNEKRTNQEITSKTIEQLIAALNEGRTEMLTHYLAGNWPIPSLGLRNVMFIASQDPLLGVLERASVFPPGHIP